VTVIQPALLTDVHVHPLAALTVAVTAPPADAIDCVVGDNVGAQGALNVNVFESALAVEPPGPTAATVAT
jgi:hypothetical protein